MRKLILLALVSIMHGATAQGQSSKNNLDTIPTIYVCKPIPVGFWEKAGVEEFAGILNSADGERAYKLLEDKIYYAMVGYDDSWDSITIYKALSSPFGEKFKVRVANIFCTQHGLTSHTTKPLVLRIAKQDSIFAERVIGQCLTDDKDHSFYSEMTIAVLDTKELKRYHKKLLQDFMQVAKNDELLSAYLVVKDDPSKEKLWSVLMKNPIGSSLLPKLFKARPEQSEVLWKKAYIAGLCLKTDDAVGIVLIDSAVAISNPYLIQVQDHVWNTLNQAQTFSDPSVLATTVEKFDSNDNHSAKKYTLQLHAMLDSFPNKNFLIGFGINRVIALANKNNYYYSSDYNKRKACQVIASNYYNADSLSIQQCLDYADQMKFFDAKEKFLSSATAKLQAQQDTHKELASLEAEPNSNFYNLAAYLKVSSKPKFSTLSAEQKGRKYERTRYPILSFLPRRYWTINGVTALVERRAKKV
jgi:hypothetical protein